jgi:hypothetical protein
MPLTRPDEPALSSAWARATRSMSGHCSHRIRDGIARRTLVHALCAVCIVGRDYRLVAPRLRLLIATATMTTTTPTRRRASPILWTLSPDECTDVANLKITPTTASTIPIASSPIPDLVFTDPQPSLLAVRACARTHRHGRATRSMSGRRSSGNLGVAKR